MTHYLCALLGHRYRPRYDSAPTGSVDVKHYVTGSEMAKILDGMARKTYCGDVCERCGAVANNKESS